VRGIEWDESSTSFHHAKHCDDVPFLRLSASSLQQNRKKTHRFVETQCHADFRANAMHAQVAGKLGRMVVQLGERQFAIPRAHSLAVWSTKYLIVNSVMDAAIMKFRNSGVPLADTLPVILREQIKLVNSGGLGSKDFGKQLLKNVGDTLHLVCRHVALAPFKEHADISTHDLDMKTNLTLSDVSMNYTDVTK
jgi:hypothetical protein